MNTSSLENEIMLVIDVESTCWDVPTPVHMTSEVIELGYALIRKGEGVVEWGSFLIPPERSTISWFCTNLTTISLQTFEQEKERVVSRQDLLPRLEAVLRKHGLHSFKSTVWCSWGDYDYNMLVKTFGKKLLNKARHINIKKRHAAWRGLAKPLGMGQALHYEDLDLLGTHHRGGDDAHNIARLALKVLGWEA